VRVVGFGTTDDPSCAVAVLAMGARAWVFADEGQGALWRAVQAVATGDTWISERTARLLTRTAPRLALLPGRHLTGRELEVLKMVVQGQSDQYIAAGLGVTRRTVRYHLTNIFDRLGASTRVEAAVLAVRLRVLD
jgi:two-component system, NarL family, nitrate/nitrite response regulator NarL